MEENNNGTPTKKSNKGLVAVLAIVIIAILVGVGYYFMKPTSPKDVFVGGINSVFDSSMKKMGEDVKKVNSTVVLSGNIESSDEEVNQVAKYINEGKLTYNVQLDKEAKKLLLAANVDYQNENLLSGKVYYASGDENVYIYVQDLFDKYFKVNMKDATGSEVGSSSMDNLFDVDFSKTIGKVDYKKATNIIKDTVASNLKDEYFSKEKVDGLTKNTMKITVGDLKQVIKNTVTSIKDNSEFMNCFEKKDDFKEIFEKLIEELNEKEEEDNYKLELSLYTKGMKNELEKMEIKVNISETKQMVINIVEIEENKFEITSDIPEFGKVKLNMEVKNDVNTDLESVNVSDSVDINNMTQADQLKIFGNLMNMKLYKYIAPLLQNRTMNSSILQN